MNLQDPLTKLPKHSIIMISGFGGSGKSTLSNHITSYLHANVISVDDFYRHIIPSTAWDCYEFERFVQDIIIPFKQGQTSTYQAYNWQDPTTILTKTFIPQDYLIIEGVGLFHPTVLPYVDVSIWIDCPIDVAVSRGKTRDKEQYHINNDELWEGIWKQNDLEAFDKYQPIEQATYIVPCSE